jgi:hypothetical protein
VVGGTDSDLITGGMGNDVLYDIEVGEEDDTSSTDIHTKTACMRSKMMYDDDLIPCHGSRSRGRTGFGWHVRNKEQSVGLTEESLEMTSCWV